MSGVYRITIFLLVSQHQQTDRFGSLALTAVWPPTVNWQTSTTRYAF